MTSSIKTFNTWNHMWKVLKRGLDESMRDKRIPPRKSDIVYRYWRKCFLDDAGASLGPRVRTQMKRKEEKNGVWYWVINKIAFNRKKFDPVWKKNNEGMRDFGYFVIGRGIPLRRNASYQKRLERPRTLDTGAWTRRFRIERYEARLIRDVDYFKCIMGKLLKF